MGNMSDLSHLAHVFRKLFRLESDTSKCYNALMHHLAGFSKKYLLLGYI